MRPTRSVLALSSVSSPRLGCSRNVTSRWVAAPSARPTSVRAVCNPRSLSNPASGCNSSEGVAPHDVCQTTSVVG